MHVEAFLSFNTYGCPGDASPSKSCKPGDGVDKCVEPGVDSSKYSGSPTGACAKQSVFHTGRIFGNTNSNAGGSGARAEHFSSHAISCFVVGGDSIMASAYGSGDKDSDHLKYGRYEASSTVAVRGYNTNSTAYTDSKSQSGDT